MSRLVPSLILVLGLTAAGAASALPVDRKALDRGAIVGEQAQAQQPPSPREMVERGKEAGVERARAMAPELKALRDEMAAQVGDLRAFVDRKYEEAGAKAMTYAIWAAVGFFALMVLASVLGGVIVALLFRRNRTS